MYDPYPHATAYEQRLRREQAMIEPRNEPLPALRTTADLQMQMAGSSTRAAIREVGKLTREIAELNPRDAETYGLMLYLRRTYVEAAACHIRRIFGCA